MFVMVVGCYRKEVAVAGGDSGPMLKSNEGWTERMLETIGL